MDAYLLHGLRKYTSPALLCIDELGYLPLDDRGAQLLFQVCSKRYEKSSTIVTTNTEPKKWGAIFNGNAMTASAILDRPPHHNQPWRPSLKRLLLILPHRLSKAQDLLAQRLRRQDLDLAPGPQHQVDRLVLRQILDSHHQRAVRRLLDA